MLSVCRDLLQQDPTLVDIWMIVANLYAANNEVKATQQVGILNFPINRDKTLVALMLSRLETLKRIYQYMSRNMRFPTLWYVRPAKPQISLHIRAD